MRQERNPPDAARQCASSAPSRGRCCLPCRLVFWVGGMRSLGHYRGALCPAGCDARPRLSSQYRNGLAPLLAPPLPCCPLTVPSLSPGSGFPAWFCAGGACPPFPSPASSPNSTPEREPAPSAHVSTWARGGHLRRGSAQVCVILNPHRVSKNRNKVKLDQRHAHPARAVARSPPRVTLWPLQELAALPPFRRPSSQVVSVSHLGTMSPGELPASPAQPAFS